MTAPQIIIADAIETAITGATDVGSIVRAASAEVLANLSSDSATVAIEYGALEPFTDLGERIAGYFDGRLEMFLDVYWAGPPDVWEARIFECMAELWRRIYAMALPAPAFRVLARGHLEPEINSDGDNQHVVIRNRFVFDVRYAVTDPEA